MITPVVVLHSKCSQKYVRTSGPSARTCAVVSNRNAWTLKQSFCEKCIKLRSAGANCCQTWCKRESIFKEGANRTEFLFLMNWRSRLWFNVLQSVYRTTGVLFNSIAVWNKLLQNKLMTTWVWFQQVTISVTSNGWVGYFPKEGWNYLL